MSVRTCKFCGCTEQRACRLIEVFPVPGFHHPYVLSPGTLVPNDVEASIVPCAWLLQDVCTNPVCVQKAYGEARLLALELAIAAEMKGVEFPAGIEWEMQP
jgi:hypothetical protein